MADLEALTISPEATVRDAIAAIDKGGRQIALVTDAERRLVAVVTDGNIRRGLLRDLSLDAPVAEVMNTAPTTARNADGRAVARRLMQERDLHHIPIVDDEGLLVDLLWIDDLDYPSHRTTPVILMAGGLGMRLRPLTETVPKPMLHIGGRPILENIIRTISEQGFSRFTICVNYLGNIIRDHFGDGSAFDVEIDYVEEHERLGTAGALSLLPDQPDEPVIVMNGDLFTSIRFDALLQFHKETGASATVCVRQFDMEIPYGVLQVDGTRLQSIVEKPVQKFLTNAGIYVLSPQAFDHLPRGRAMDMPDLLTDLTAKGETVSAFLTMESWLDIGRKEDLEWARDQHGRLVGA